MRSIDALIDNIMPYFEPLLAPSMAPKKQPRIHARWRSGDSEVGAWAKGRHPWRSTLAAASVRPSQSPRPSRGQDAAPAAKVATLHRVATLPFSTSRRGHPWPRGTTATTTTTTVRAPACPLAIHGSSHPARGLKGARPCPHPTRSFSRLRRSLWLSKVSTPETQQPNRAIHGAPPSMADQEAPETAPAQVFCYVPRKRCGARASRAVWLALSGKPPPDAKPPN